MNERRDTYLLIGFVVLIAGVTVGSTLWVLSGAGPRAEARVTFTARGSLTPAELVAFFRGDGGLTELRRRNSSLWAQAQPSFTLQVTAGGVTVRALARTKGSATALLEDLARLAENRTSCHAGDLQAAEMGTRSPHKPLALLLALCMGLVLSYACALCVRHELQGLLSKGKGGSGTGSASGQKRSITFSLRFDRSALPLVGVRRRRHSPAALSLRRTYSITAMRRCIQRRAAQAAPGLG